MGSSHAKIGSAVSGHHDVARSSNHRCAGVVFQRASHRAEESQWIRTHSVLRGRDSGQMVSPLTSAGVLPFVPQSSDTANR